MALLYPKSRKDEYRNGNKPNNGGIVWKFFKRTINITDYRNAKDEVNPAKNRTFGGIYHDWLVNIFVDPAPPGLARTKSFTNFIDFLIDRNVKAVFSDHKLPSPTLKSSTTRAFQGENVVFPCLARFRRCDPKP